MIDLEYNDVAHVLDAWDSARRLTSDEEFGQNVLGRFLSLAPEAESLFANVKNHGDNIVSLFDTLFQLLGPDLDFLGEICQQIGDRHSKVGVKDEYITKMGVALLQVLQETLGDKFTEEDKDAWNHVYEKFSEEIFSGMK